jgi:hypothetical protein
MNRGDSKKRMLHDVDQTCGAIRFAIGALRLAALKQDGLYLLEPEDIHLYYKLEQHKG